jgi:hypothetical protein
MELSYLLRIECDSSLIEAVNQILDKQSCSIDDWEIELIERESDPPTDFVNIFLNVLHDKYDKLLCLGIERRDISIWIYYEYNQQCNMEILPNQMQSLGNNGVVLCISCWQNTLGGNAEFGKNSTLRLKAFS